MASIADYVIVMDGSASMSRAAPNLTNFVRKHFPIPDNIASGRPSVLMYRLEADNADNLKYTVTLNDTDVLTLTHSTDRFGTVHEVVEANVLHNGDNRFMVIVTAGTGTLKISDVVLLIQVDV